MLDTGSVNINMLQVLEVAEDLLKRSLTCKGLEEKRVDMFPKEGAKMSKESTDLGVVNNSGSMRQERERERDRRSESDFLGTSTWLSCS